MTSVAMITIGETPRDDLVPYIAERLPGTPRILQRGILDGRSLDQQIALGPDGSEIGSCARRLDGTRRLVVFRKIFPIMQSLVTEVEEEGADIVVILCSRDWSDIRSRALVVNPGTLFPAVVASLAHGRHLGVIKPLQAQVEPVCRQFRTLGIETDADFASPYAGDLEEKSAGLGSQRLVEAARAATSLRRDGVDLIWMSCVDMDEEMRTVVADTSGVPVILARSLLAGLVHSAVLSVSAPSAVSPPPRTVQIAAAT